MLGSLRDNRIGLTDPNEPANANNERESEEEQEVVFDLTESETLCSLGRLLLVLASNSSLRLLDLCYNELHMTYLTSSVCQEFSNNATLQYLLLNDNRLIANEASSAAFTTFIANLPQVRCGNKFACIDANAR